MIFIALLALAVTADAYTLDRDRRPNDGNLIRSLCEQNGGNTGEAEFATYKFVRCIGTDFGAENLEKEIKEATNSHSSYDNIIKKYCAKTPLLKHCYNELLNATGQCLGGDKQLVLTTLRRISDQIVDYACNNDGDVISEFVNESGPQCFSKYKLEIVMCAETYKYKLMAMGSSVTETHIQHLNKEVLQCVIDNVESCHNPAVSRIVKRIVEIISNGTQALTSTDTVKSQSETVPHPGVGTDMVSTPVTTPAPRRRTDYNRTMPPQFIELQKKCEENGVSSRTFQEAITVMTKCVESEFDFKTIAFEFVQSRETQSYDVFFKKYCAKVPQLSYCYNNIMNVISPCLGDQGKNLTLVAKNINTQMLNFVCANDGARLTRFVKEGGLECYESKVFEVMECSRIMNTTMSLLPVDNSLSNKHTYVNYEKAVNCVVRKLESCDTKVPSEMFRSLAEIIHQNISPEVQVNVMNGTAPGKQTSSNTTKRYNYSTQGKQVSSNNSETPHYKTSGTITLTFNADIFV